MNESALVSVVIPFLDAARFLEETIRGVQDQTYENWELLLVDDGSSDGSSDIARRWAASHSRVQYLHHENHENRGISASRNLGVRQAKGKYVALLDADDLYRPEKIERQVELLERHPEAALVYGKTLYWYSWTGAAEDVARDRVQPHGFAADVLLQPPRLVARFISGRAAVPTPCSVLVRREAVLEIGGFEESFRGMYEDQVFFAKMFSTYPVFVSNECLDRYRQHSASISTVSEKAGELLASRRRFLAWLVEYLLRREEPDPEVWQAVRRELWLVRDRFGLAPSIQRRLRWLEQWILRAEGALVPAGLRRWLWTRRVPSLAEIPNRARGDGGELLPRRR